LRTEPFTFWDGLQRRIKAAQVVWMVTLSSLVSTAFSKVKIRITDLVTLQGGIIISVVFCTDNTEIRGVDLSGMTWEIRQFSIWFCQE
jgi:hypothetical protein